MPTLILPLPLAATGQISALGILKKHPRAFPPTHHELTLNTEAFISTVFYLNFSFVPEAHIPHSTRNISQYLGLHVHQLKHMMESRGAITEERRYEKVLQVVWLRQGGQQNSSAKGNARRARKILRTIHVGLVGD